MEEHMSEKDEMQEIIEEFVVEANELAEKAIQDIVAIENNRDDEIINSIFRAVHTIKGTSSFLGFNTLSVLAHKSEDILGMVRKGTITPDRNVGDVLLEALDLIRTLIEDIKVKGAEERETGPTIEKLELLANPEKRKLGEILVEEKVLSTDELQGVLKKQEDHKEKKLGELLVEEKLLTEEQVKSFVTKQKTHKEEQTIRIEVKKLDELMNLAGELVLGKNRLIVLNNTVKKKESGNGALDNLADVTNYIEAVTNELQLSVMRARLVPIGKLFNKVPRMVRDLSGEFKKEIELKMEGEETELDRSLIEGLHDPLTHVIRNSVDHGVEMPDDREQKGKSARGFLSLRAYNEGNSVIIEVFDDGKGINVDAVKEKAREKGLMSEADANALSRSDALNLIFAAGLSTAKKVTSISGRGVGMDVVKTNIEKMNGQVSIESEEGKWTKLTMRLPLTLAIMRALIVQVRDQLFAIPLNMVTELVKLTAGLIKSVDKKEVLVLRDKVIPVIDLARIFLQGDSIERDNYIIICNIGDKTIGIKARAVEGQEEVVIKPLGEFLGNIKGIGGATIRGDGKAILILDMSSMLATALIQNGYRKSA
jgi:two-component system, chemotaxis family, sensor kinase CheA